MNSKGRGILFLNNVHKGRRVAALLLLQFFREVYSTMGGSGGVDTMGVHGSLRGHGVAVIPLISPSTLSVTTGETSKTKICTKLITHTTGNSCSG